ncbi:MAG: M48 family metalloprotease [Pseudomonadales bacterium]
MSAKPYKLPLTTLLIMCLSAAMLGGCAVNPVTGKSELSLVDERQEINLGTQQYQPSQQAQGGRYASDPQLTEYVSRVGQRLARAADRRLPYEFVIIDDSTPNAWALPGGKIAINRGLLLRLNSEAELAAVLSHEIVHAAARHGAKSIERSLLLSSVMTAAGSAIESSDSRYGDLLDNGAQIGAQFIVSSYGREAELESDRYGMVYMVRAGYDPTAAVSLQETFVALSKNRASSWLEGLLASHPPSQERVFRNQQTAERLTETLGGNLIQGFDRYQAKLNRLSALTPAYDLTTDARRALESGDTEQATNLINEALRLTETEAGIHGAAGQIALASKQPQKAVAHFTAAIKINAIYYQYFLGRGFAHQALGKLELARQDFEASQQLFKTNAASKALTEL